MGLIQTSRLFVAFMLLLLTATFVNAHNPTLAASATAMTHGSPQPSDSNAKISVMAEVIPFPPYHAAGNDVPTILRLKRENGLPVTLEDLRVSDAASIDLLIIDESLSDFHYQHLTATDTAGEYRFVLRSRYGGRYFVWAGISRQPSGEKQFVKATVQVEGASKAIERVTKWTATVDEFRYHLSLADGSALIAGEPAHLNLSVTNLTRESVDISPTMRRLASLSAFAADFQSATLMFPTEDSNRAAPDREARQLTFIFTPPSPGFWKLFSEVKLGGWMRVASFGVNVSEASRCKECADTCRCAEACSKMAT